MAINTTQVGSANDDVVQQPNLTDRLSQGILENLFLLRLLTDVSSQFVPGMDAFKIHQWGMAGAVENTLENGSDQSDGGMTTYKQTLPCDQDKKNSLIIYDKADLISALDYRTGFFATAPIQHARAMEAYVAGLMRAAANTSITADGTTDLIDQDTMEALAIAFDEQNLPKQGRRLVVTPTQKHALIKAFSLKDVSVAGSSEELRNGLVTRLYGFDVYEANTHILPTADANQAMAFVADAAFWGMQLNPEAEVERQAQKSRWYMSVRSKYGAKINTFPNADGSSVSRIYLVGKAP
jgi:hypothetical protein